MTDYWVSRERHCERAALSPPAGHGAEEASWAEVVVVVQVDIAGGLVELPQVVLEEQDVAGLLVLHVTLDDVVEAVGVARVVVLEAAAAYGVLHLDALLLRVGDIAALEDELGAVLAGSVAEVVVVDHVGVGDAVGVDGVPAVDEHGYRQRLVANRAKAWSSVGALGGSVEDLLADVETEGLGGRRSVLAPLALLGDALEEVEGLGVVLGVVLVERGPPVAREGVVDPLLALRHVGLAAGLPALHEEHLHVVVGQGLQRRDGGLLRTPVVEALQELSELPRVQNNKTIIKTLQLRPEKSETGSERSTATGATGELWDGEPAVAERRASASINVTSSSARSFSVKAPNIYLND